MSSHDAPPQGDANSSSTSSNPTTTTTTTTTTTATATTSNYLIKFARDFVEALNNHDFDKATSYGSAIDHSCFSAAMMNFPIVWSFEEHINTFRIMAAMAPNSSVRIVDITTNVDEGKGFADVYIYSELVNGWMHKGVSQLQWVRKDGTWLCFKHVVMKGVEDIV